MGRTGTKVRTRVWNRFGGVCQDCGIKTHLKQKQTPDQGTIEHIIPRSLGGSHRKENLTLLCYQCNQKRDNKLHEKAAWTRNYKSGYQFATNPPKECSCKFYKGKLKKIKSLKKKPGFREGFEMGTWALKFRR